MSEETHEIQAINWRQCFSFQEILRSFRMAIHPTKLLLCLLALVATAWGAWAVDQIPGVGQTNVAVIGAADLNLDGRISLWDNLNHVLTKTLWGTWALPYVGAKTWDDFFTFLMTPVSAAKELVLLAVAYWEETPWFALVNTIIGLGIWAFIGGAVTRMAAVRIAREENLPLKRALAFSCRKWPSIVSSPLIPFGVLVLVALGVGLVTGFALMVPYAGEVVVSLLFGLTLMMGLVMALIFVGGAFSVGLQWPTIAAEGSDAFDAISRSVAYISSRPWRYLFYTVFSAVYGCLTFIFVKFVAFLTLRLTHEAVSTFTWNWHEAGDKLPRIWAVPTMANPWPAAGGEPWASTDAFATVLISLYVWIVLGLMVSFLISFFFSSQTVIYFLLRKIVDATDMEEVYVEESEEEELPIGEKAEGPKPAKFEEAEEGKSE
ncbi:MAG: hypothetical protein NTX40_00725 [Planctomycetota bacterium]|nr:hypothetical protein [Planctomycetota bacterium]